MNPLVCYAVIGLLVWIGAFIYFVRDEKNISIADIIEGLFWTFIIGCIWPFFLGAISSETRFVKMVGRALDDWWTKPRWKV